MVCAYVALFADAPARADHDVRRPRRRGYIVTPDAARRARPHAAGRQAVGQDPVRRGPRYAAPAPSRAPAADQAVALVTDDARRRRHQLPERHRPGQERRVVRDEGRPHRSTARRLYADPLRDITDQIGVRVITYVHSDVAAVADLLRRRSCVVLDDRDMGQETASEGRFGYASRHLLVGLDAAARPAGVRALRGRRRRCRSAPCSSTRGRSSSTTSATRAPSPTSTCRDFDRRFTLAAGLLELADREFSTIRDRLRGGVDRAARPAPSDDDPRISAARAGGVPRRAVRRRRLVAHRPLRLDRPGCCSSSASPRSTSSARRCARSTRDAITARMDYRYPPGAVRRLDDALLAAFGERYVDLHGNAHRGDLLAARLARLTAQD